MINLSGFTLDRLEFAMYCNCWNEFNHTEQSSFTINESCEWLVGETDIEADCNYFDVENDAPYFVSYDLKAVKELSKEYDFTESDLKEPEMLEELFKNIVIDYGFTYEDSYRKVVFGLEVVKVFQYVENRVHVVFKLGYEE